MSQRREDDDDSSPASDEEKRIASGSDSASSDEDDDIADGQDEENASEDDVELVVKRRSKAERDAAKKAFQGTLEKFRRGQPVTKKQLKGVTDKKLKARLSRYEKQARESAMRTAEAQLLQTEPGGFLEPEGEMERTFKVKQEELREMVDEQTQAAAAF
mmetsp:Transcript_51303/g.125988  ORF Transcript_51303/g.125988 Transcript_51303/m.125988 type:complete len:159 (+) Transcript_51303:16-492(+)